MIALFLGGLLAAALPQPSPLTAPPRPASAVPFERVTITDGFWSTRQAANAQGTLLANLAQCEATGRIENFVKAAKGEGKYEGYFFNDSDVYKAIEGACNVLAQTRDPELDARLDRLIAIIAAAQQPDGYLNAYITLMEPGKRWADLPHKHELYCAGHLIEAGVAHHRATGKRSLLDVAVRFADNIDSVFGPAPKRNGVPGHEEIEIALIRLAQETGEPRYLRLAQYFLAQRGNPQQVGAAQGDGQARELYGDYCQDHLPLAQQEHAVGHAVRAMYLYTAAADLAIHTGDQSYTPALERIWDELTGTKMYITGGIGNSSTNEGFTTPYDLPNDSAYAETCAGIGLVMWGHRMALLHGEHGARYMDVVERGLYNGVLSGVSQDGARFFYVNPLASRGAHHRREWYACACCPPNILRLVAQVGGMAYAQTPGSLLVNLYINSRAELDLLSESGKPIKATLEQRTQYPWDGDVRLLFSMPEPAQFDLMLRLPAWCRGAELSVNDERVKPEMYDGYASVRRTWKDGDKVKWLLSMPIERVHAHQGVKPNLGRVALQRGPIVYCFESADNPGVSVRGAALPALADLRVDRLHDLLGGVSVLRAKAIIPGADASPDALYSHAAPKPVTLTAIPYFAWDNRAPGDMQVWMPESLALADVPPDPTITPSASHRWTGDTLQALYDRQDPATSADHSIPRFTFWPRKGTTEWVQYDFSSPRSIGSVEVYWFDDHASGGGCALPQSWRVLCMIDGDWKEVASGAACPISSDTFNTARFPALTTSAVRLEVTLRAGDAPASAGILEWRVRP